MITFTEDAANEVREVVKETGEDCAGLRIRALRLGRFTFRYQLHLVREEDVLENDTKIEGDGFAVYLDPQTAEWMEDATVDFIEVEGQKGFQIQNPAAEPEWDDPVAKKVQKVLDQQVLPAIAQHGGWVELSSVEGDTAYVVLGGGCQGCASAGDTLKHGIESILVQEVAEISEVKDATDHTAGDNPYYSG